MKPKLLVQSFIRFGPLALLTGCVGYNTALFMTKSNAGLDFDSKPPTAEVNISRKEGVVEPTFEGGKTPPVMATFSTKSGSGGGLGRFFFGVDQTFAGGDAAVTMAKLYNSPTNSLASKSEFDSGLSLSKIPKANTQTGKGWLGLKKKMFGLPEPGEVRPFFFGTDTQLGVKVGWNGLGGPYPDNLKVGFNRKEIAVAPITFTPREDDTRTNIVRIPSFLATVDSNVEAGGDVQVGWMQYFATGESADYLARQPGVRKAMRERADPKAAAERPRIENEARTMVEDNAKRISAIIGFVVGPDGKVNAARLGSLTNGLPDVNDAWMKTYVNQPTAKFEKDLKGISNHRVPTLYRNIK